MSEPLFPFRPNWSRPLVERLEWLTDVQESKNASEERISLRSFPRRSLEFDLWLKGQAQGRLDALLWGNMGRRYVVPIWTDRQNLDAPLAAGAEAIPVTTAGYDYTPSGLAVLWVDDATYEVVTVDTVAADEITLVTPTSDSWPAGTRVYPARYGRLPEKVSLVRPSATVVQASLRFDLENGPSPVIPGATTYLGIEVDLRSPNWEQAIDTSYDRKLETLDYSLGPVFVDDLSNWQRITRTHRYLLDSRSDIAEYRGWLHAREGRANAFWQPQRQQDLIQDASISAASAVLRVRSLNYTSNYNLAAGRQDLAIYHVPSGQWYLRRILSVSPVFGDREDVTLDDPLGINADPGDLRIFWLTLSRLDADGVEIAWHSDTVAVSALGSRSVRQ